MQTRDGPNVAQLNHDDFPPPTLPSLSTSQSHEPSSSENRKPNVTIPETRAIFVGNFEYDSRTADVERLFAQYGPVARVDLKRGFAFVFMQNEQQGEAAIRGLDGRALDETRRRPLKVEWARGDGAIKRREDERRKRAAEPSETLFVVNFDPVTTTRQLLDLHFSRFGHIVRLDLQQRFAFIQFEKVSHAAVALQALNGMLLGDRYLIVEYTVRNGPSGPGRKRHRDRMMGPHGGSRSMVSRGYFHRGRSPSPRNAYGSMSHDRPWGPSYPREYSRSPYESRERDHMPHRDESHGIDTGSGEYRDGDRVVRDREDRKRRYERFGESREGDMKYHRQDRSLSPAKGWRRLSKSLSRGRSRSGSRSGRNRSVSRERKTENGPHSRDQRRGSRSRSRSPYMSWRRMNRSHSRSPMRDRSRSRSPVKDRNESRSPLRKRARSLSDERLGKIDGKRSRSRSRNFSPRHRRGRSPCENRSRDRSRSGSLSRRRIPIYSGKSIRSRSPSKSYSPRFMDTVQNFSERRQDNQAMKEDGDLRNHESGLGEEVTKATRDKNDAAAGEQSSVDVVPISPNGTSLSPLRKT